MSVVLLVCVENYCCKLGKQKPTQTAKIRTRPMNLKKREQNPMSYRFLNHLPRGGGDAMSIMEERMRGGEGIPRRSEVQPCFTAVL